MNKRVSYSGNTSAFQADAVSSILTTRSTYIQDLRDWANDCVAREIANRAKPIVSTVKLLKTFKSSSSDAIYKVHQHPYGVTCTCPGFTFRRKCKHL